MTINKTYEHTIYIDDDTPVDVEIVVTLEKDNNYGADADGNRGVTMYFADDYEYKVLGETITDKKILDFIDAEVVKFVEDINADVEFEESMEEDDYGE